MPVNLRGRHYLKLLDYTPAEIRYLLELSKDFKRMKRAGTPHRYLAGKNIGQYTHAMASWVRMET